MIGSPRLPPAAPLTARGQKYCKGLPRGTLGKVTVAVAPSDGRRVYAMIEAQKGGLVACMVLM